jgi:hypothetical protein
MDETIPESGPGTPAVILTSDDLRKLLALAVRADVKIGDVPNFFLSVQRLEMAAKSGHDYIALTG